MSDAKKAPRFALAAIDIDDTLVGHDGAISEANAAAVRRLLAIGTRVLLASGRSHANMLPFHRQLGQTLVAYRAHARVRRFLALHEKSPRTSLLALALKAGFGSYAQFHRTFRANLPTQVIPVKHDGGARIRQ